MFSAVVVGCDGGPGDLLFFHSSFSFFHYSIGLLIAYAKLAQLALVHLLRAGASGDDGGARKVRMIPGRSVSSPQPLSLSHFLDL